MSKSTSTSKWNKQAVSYLVLVSVCVVAITLLVYVPIWHHNQFVLGAVGVIMGYRFITTTKSGELSKAVRELVLSGLMVFGAWNHLWLLMVVAVVASAVLHFRDFLKE